MKKLLKHLAIYFAIFLIVSCTYAIRAFVLGEEVFMSIILGVVFTFYAYTILAPFIIIVEVTFVILRSLPPKRKTEKKVVLKSELKIELTGVAKLINDTSKPVIEIIAAPTKRTEITQSKFFGTPYFLQSQLATYPKDSNRNPMKMIAQINFRDLKPSVNLPSTGILQFYVSQEFFSIPEGKVIYHEEIVSNKSLLIEDFSFIEGTSMDEDLKELFPSKQEFSLKFTQKVENITFSDFQFEKMLSVEDFKKYNWDDAKELKKEGIVLPGDSHKLLGYPNFTQEDPRLSNEKIKDYILLFQMKSHGVYDRGEINWNNQGLCNFFISPLDLEKHDFSRVFFYND